MSEERRQRKDETNGVRDERWDRTVIVSLSPLFLGFSRSYRPVPVTLPPIPPLLSSAAGLLPPGGMVRIRVTNVEKERVEKQTTRGRDEEFGGIM